MHCTEHHNYAKLHCTILGGSGNTSMDYACYDYAVWHFMVALFLSAQCTEMRPLDYNLRTFLFSHPIFFTKVFMVFMQFRATHSTSLLVTVHTLTLTHSLFFSSIYCLDLEIRRNTLFLLLVLKDLRGLLFYMLCAFSRRIFMKIYVMILLTFSDS